MLVERAARSLRAALGWPWLEPYAAVGVYGAQSGQFSWSWYLHQLVQAIVLIGFPARVVALSIIMLSIATLPQAVNPVRCRTAQRMATRLRRLIAARLRVTQVLLIARGWFYSGLRCDQQRIAILYLLPLTGDAIQFIIIDKLQAFSFLKQVRTMSTCCVLHYARCPRSRESSRACAPPPTRHARARPQPTESTSDSEDGQASSIQMTGQERVARSLLPRRDARSDSSPEHCNLL